MIPSGPEAVLARPPAEPAEGHDAILDRAFSRVTGSEPLAGNAVRLLKDATQNYPAWLDAIRRAERTIHFENYIVADDEVGRTFADALIERARRGVKVRFLYDWWGSLGKASRGYWARLRAAGIEVRCFNPPQWSSPVACFRRDHRKVMTVDGRLAFVSGLCLARPWLGDPQGGVPPWRDTGVELRGPVVADVDQAFAESWRLSGGAISPEERILPEDLPEAGPIRMRVVRGRPGQLSTYRVDQLVAAAARHTLWLTDAYFVATTAFVQVLTEAARDGVDVRLLVPGSIDVPGVQTLVRSNYRPLLEAGIRIFEWNGSMLHAKSAVCDGRWARIGSTNLNLTSWLTNWELDITIEDAGFARLMEATYLEDLGNATEVVLDERRRVHPMGEPPRPPHAPHGQRHKGSGGRLAAGAIGLGSTAGAAITGSRPLSATESRVIAKIGVVFLMLACSIFLFPRAVVFPVAFALAWLGWGLLLRAWRLARGSRGAVSPP
ncbi:phospholipase D-like domain-containing protein [Benzoatithermus flavus]|uniref:Phospholipase D n=1 Tax=Benzoatithermus flavus TaxID=3108223 RepID=A0ABU8XZI4_9PROT